MSTWGTCNAGSNNIHFDFPPIMNDGRNYATWQPGAVVNEKIREENNIKDNASYREYLVLNADKIIQNNQMESCNYINFQSVKRSCYCKTPSTPYLYKSTVDNSQPFGYENSDLKQLYLSRQQLQSRMVTPIINQDQLLQNKYSNYN